jgi:hypothetical protein
MEPLEYTFDDFYSTINPGNEIIQFFDIYIREYVYPIMTSKIDEFSSLDAYSRDFPAWIQGKTKVVVYPDDMTLLRNLAGPALSLIKMDPLPLLSAATILICKFRMANKVHRLDIPETAIFLYLNLKGSEWTKKNDLKSEMMDSDVEFSDFNNTLNKLVEIGIIEKKGRSFRVITEYRS